MFEAFKSWDDWLLDRFEAFSHWTQQWFGLTSKTWQRLFLAATVIALIWNRAQLPSIGAADKVICGFLLLSWTVDWFDPSNIGRFSDSLAANPKRLTQRWLRISSLLILAFALFHDIKAIDVWWEFRVPALYFEACGDLPWSKSKIRQLLGSLKGILSLRPQPTTS